MEEKETMMAKVKITYRFYGLPNIHIAADIIGVEPIVFSTIMSNVKIYFPINAEETQKIKAREKELINTVAIELDVKEKVNLNEERWERQFNKDVEEIFFKFFRLLRRKLPNNCIPIPRNLKYQVNVEIIDKPKEYKGPDRLILVDVTMKRIEKYLEANHWSDLNKEMSIGIETELWEDFIIEAKVALKEKDYNLSVIYSAISCEVFIKRFVNKLAVTRNISEKFLKYINTQEPEIRAIRYYGPILHLVIGHSLEDEKEELYKAIERIFRKRNDIMHEGQRIFSKDEHNELIKDIDAIQEAINWVINCSKEHHLDHQTI